MNGNLNQPIKRYMPGLDGLRALSVLAVIAYHLDLQWAQGGLLGVGIFFVLSGYLITDQIILVWKTSKRLSIVNFWIRRLRRLLPAMICMLMFVALWLICIDFSRFQALKGDFLSSLFYVNNWYLIFHKVSYFESFGPPSPIGHLWSLSIEEQFYVVWPIVLVIGIKLVPHRGKLLLWILVCAAISAIAMAIIYKPGTDPSRVYYGTDTRAFALLIGAALAVIWPSWKLSHRISSSARTLLDAVGSLGVFTLMILMVRTNEFDDSLYRGGFLYLSFLTAAVIAVLAHPGSRLGKIMGCKPLVWVGKRSYSLYIWHYPVIILSSPAVNTEGVRFTHILLQLTVSFILSALSYKYVEEPVRRGHFLENLKEIRMRAPCRRLSRLATRIPIVLIMAAMVMLFLIQVSWSMDLAKPQPESDLPAMVQESSPKEDTHINNPAEDDTYSDTGEGITAIGDSVILDAASILEDLLPGIVIDGKIGRQMSQAQAVVDELRAQGKLGSRVILELGTNGAFSKNQLRALLDSLHNAERIYLVTTRVPKDWQDIVNASIREVADEYGNTTIIDWYSASEGRNELFYQDGVHLKPEGAQYYASILVEAIRQDTSH
jgi:peptidoglycan/LPS O-acetylase OafA/YrhL